MSERPRQLHFNVHVSVGGGNHEASWRHPRSDQVRMTALNYHRKIAAIAERGKLDAIFFGDTPSLSGDVKFGPLESLDPIALYGALSAVTERIGLAATISTTFNEPFNVARKVLSLDHLSGGRVGWNIVTTSSESAARNFGRNEIVSHSDRYRQAEDFVQVVTKLWDSWESGAVLNNQQGGVYADPDLIHRIAHDGAFFRVDGPLNLSRSPQGRPVLIQAGSSDNGVAFAARYAEIVFTAQRTLEEGQRFYKELKRQVSANRRDHERVKVVVGLSPIIGATEADAKKLSDELNELMTPAYGLRQIQNFCGVDLSGYPLDGPVPLDAFPEIDSVEAHRSRTALLVTLARREKLSLGQLLHRFAGARGHQTIVGTPEQVAARIEEWFTKGAADGFNFMPAYLPGGLEDFVDHVVPILQRKGLFRRDYEGDTLRDHYDLDVPLNRYSIRAG
jgi:FMN-dependent oxidoreductase (nitrilotriacetate monooxygenase family)